MTDPYTAQGVARMYPGTLGGQARVVTPVDPIRRPRRKKRPFHCPVQQPDPPGTTVSIAYDLSGLFVWTLDTTSGSEVRKLDFPAYTTALTLIDANAYVVFGGNVAGDALYAQQVTSPSFYNVVVKQTAGGSITELSERVGTTPDPFAQWLGGCYDHNADEVAYLRYSGTTDQTTVDLKKVTMGGTVTTLYTFAAPVSGSNVFGPWVTASGSYWWTDWDFTDIFVHQWTAGGGEQIATITAPSLQSLNVVSALSDGSVVLALDDTHPGDLTIVSTGMVVTTHSCDPFGIGNGASSALVGSTPGLESSLMGTQHGSGFVALRS